MRNIIVIFAGILLTLSLNAQERIGKKELEQIKKNAGTAKLLLDTDADFGGVKSTDKWNTESAIVLCQKTRFEFDKKGISAGKRIGRNVLGLLFAIPTLGTSIVAANMDNTTKILVEESERRKLLLRDKFAIDQYSMLYFRLTSEGDAFAARVIKKDGSSQPLDLTDAVRIDNASQVPVVYRSYTEESGRYGSRYYKIAVQGLEEGDILEYEFKHYNNLTYGSNPSYKEFDPIYYLCNRNMPVAKQVIEVSMENSKYYLGYKPLKGAPEFKETVTGDNRLYRWVDEGRDKLQDTRFVNEYLENPSVKFQVIYAKESGKNFILANDNSAARKDINTVELGNKLKNFWYNPGKVTEWGDYTEGLSTSIDKTVSEMYKTLKKREITEGSDDDYVRKTFYTIRSKTMMNNWNDFAFAKVFAGLLDKKKLPYEIIVSTSNSRTQLDKVAFLSEIRWLVKYKNQYYANPYDHGNPGEIPVYLAGNKMLHFAGNSETAKIENDVLPPTDTTVNQLSTKIVASVDVSNMITTVDATIGAKGLPKIDITDEILAYTPYMELDYRNYDGTDMWEELPARSREEASSKFMDQKKEWKEEKSKMMEARIEDMYNAKLEKYLSFKVMQDGRSYKKEGLVYNEKFSLSELATTADEDILFALTALMGDQIKIKNEESTRTQPVDMRYPYKRTWSITMAVPAGYEVKGLTALNKTVNNECGSFTATAVVENGNIVLQASRNFNSKLYDAAQWPQILDILNTVYNYTQAKVVLKKVK